MKKIFTCIICPNGCEIEVELDNDTIAKIEGATCKKGKEYVNQEITNPRRNIATSVKVLKWGCRYIGKYFEFRCGCYSNKKYRFNINKINLLGILNNYSRRLFILSCVLFSKLDKSFRNK